MTVSISIVRNPDYYQDDLEDSIDYYVQAEAQAKPDAARWFGALAKDLGMDGKLMTAEDSLYILNGFDPRSKIPPGMGAEEALNAKMLKPLRKSADAQALGMSLLSREVRQLKKAEASRDLSTLELERLADGESSLKDWNARLRETREVAQEHDKLMAGKKAGVVWDDELRAMVPYAKAHEDRREELGKKLATLPGGQRQAVDFTFSMCKEISIVYARASDEEKTLMRAAFQEEISLVLERRIAMHAQTRDYAGVKRGESPKVVRAGGIASVVVHDTTRAVREDRDGRDMDQVDGAESIGAPAVLKGMAPGLHGHGIVGNLSIDEKGETRSLSTEELEDMRKEMDAEAHARVVARFNALINARGERFCSLDIGEPHGKAVVGISAPGVEREDVESMSGRSLAIKAIRDKAAADGKVVDYSYGKLETREAKLQDADLAQTYAHWQEHLDERGITRATLGMGAEGSAAREAVDDERGRRAKNLATMGELMDFALLERMSAGKNYFTASDLRRALWVDAIGHGNFDIESRAERILNNPVLAKLASQEVVDKIVGAGKMKRSDEKVFVLSQALREEQEFDAVVRRMVQGGAKAHDLGKVRAVIQASQDERQKESQGFVWREDQIAMIEGVLTSPCRGLVVKAPPGSGKTTALSAIVAFCKQEGIGHIMLAPSHKAKGQAMRDAAMEEGHAIQGFVRKRSELDKVKEGTMVFVDESSMVDMPDMLRLYQEVEKRGGRIVTIGDTNQLAAIGRGDPMMRFQEIAPNAVLELDKITRQRGDAQAHREYIMAQYEGRHEDFVEMLEQMGLIKVFDTVEAKREALAESFMATKAPLEQRTITGGTNDECASVNAMIRQRLIEAGSLAAEGVSFACETAGGLSEREFRQGERILFVKGVGEAGADGKTVALADTADTGTIVSVKVGKDKKSVDFEVAVDGKGIIRFNAKNGAALDYAYMITTHRSQGITQDFSPHSFDSLMSGSESLLVGTSRHRSESAVFCTVKERELLEVAAARRTEKVRANQLSSASAVEMGANALLAKFSGELRRAEHVGGKALESFHERLAAASSKLSMAGPAAIAQSYTALASEGIQVNRQFETKEQAFTRRVVEQALKDISTAKALDVPFESKARAKAAGAIWIPERRAWGAPQDKEAVLLSMFRERKDAVLGSIARPLGTEGLASIEGRVQGLSNDGKGLLVWDDQGRCRSIPLSNRALEATGKEWSKNKGFGQRLAELQGAKVKIDLEASSVRSVEIFSGDRTTRFSISKHGRLEAQRNGAKANLNPKGLAQTVSIDAKESARQHRDESFERRARQSVLLAVPVSEAKQARQAGADYDKDARTWFAPSGADLSALKRWEALQVPVRLSVDFDGREHAKALGARWSKQESAWIAPAGTSLESALRLIPGDALDGTDAMGRPILDVPYAERKAAKAAGATFDKELRSWVAPRGLEEALVGIWGLKSSAPIGSRENPRKIASETATFDCVVESLRDGKLVWREQSTGAHCEIGVGGSLLEAKLDGWGGQSVGEKLAALGAHSAAVKIDIENGAAVAARIAGKRGELKIELDGLGGIKAELGGAKVELAPQGIEEIAGVDLKALDRGAREAALAIRAAESTILAVPARDIKAAKAAGARFDPEAKAWYAGSTPKLETLSAWACTQGRKPLAVAFEQKEQAKALGAQWDADAKQWYAPVGTPMLAMAALEQWTRKPESELTAPAMSRAQEWEMKIGRDRVGAKDRPVRLAAIPQDYFDGAGRLAAEFVADTKVSKTGELVAVFKVKGLERDVFFIASTKGHTLAPASEGGRGHASRLAAKLRAGAAARVEIERSEDGSLGEVRVEGESSPLLTQARESQRRQAAVQSQIEAQSLKEAKERAAPEARKVESAADQKPSLLEKVKQAIAKGLAIGAAGASDSPVIAKASTRAAQAADSQATPESRRAIEIVRLLESSRVGGILAGSHWESAVKLIVEGGFDPAAVHAGKSMLHHLAEHAPLMQGSTRTHAGLLTARQTLALAEAAFGPGAMDHRDSEAATVAQALARGEQAALKAQAVRAAAVANLPDGMSIDKPIDAAKAMTEKTLDGFIARVDDQSLVFRAIEGKVSTFYRVPRVDAFGSVDKPGVEADATSKQPMKIQLVAGSATRLFISNPELARNKHASKELAISRGSGGGYFVDATQQPISAKQALAQSSSEQLAASRLSAQRGSNFKM